MQILSFAEIDLSDRFFDSLKLDYAEFAAWFDRKRASSAYVSQAVNGIDGFLYLKLEHESVDDANPPLPAARRLKIGTFKIDAHGTRLGERFLKKAFDCAMEHHAAELYVTVFERHATLCDLFRRYGFQKVGVKLTRNGEEAVMVRDLRQFRGDVVLDYPAIPVLRDRHFLLALKPEWHSRLLPDSLLATEKPSIVLDVSHSNSIHKLYLTAMSEASRIRRGDTIIIYRTTDHRGPAYHRSVATSVCVAEEVRNIHEFSGLESFLSYADPYSVFSRAELTQFFTKKTWPTLLRFTYNLALSRRITRAELIESVGLDQSLRWGCIQLTSRQFASILKLSGDYESAIINKTAFR